MENTWKEKYILFYEKNNQRIQMVMWALFIASLIFSNAAYFVDGHSICIDVGALFCMQKAV